ncbi:Site-specific recombinase XerD [Mycobacteroides abscessus subsp. abscessus]|uniref:integrase n=1 Tax=Mycobacteroides abscessus TaxID=36809 RepID=UPI00092C0F52|nr:integrase [Mycobacteroides abscessus]SHT89426.1 Site-specific recombinase XerD [Mycobacteroides abscessus subsp. abscessus]SLL32996.1 Site-specific recombinase XerD [Mycobacteroides abscessus subsp. abscessus]
MPTLPTVVPSRNTSLAKPLPLTLPLDATAAIQLTTVVAKVSEHWNISTCTGAMSTQTAVKFTLLASRFERFAAAHGATTIDTIGNDLVLKFVTAPGRTRHGAVSGAAVATMHNRRSALRALFRTARLIGLIINDPTSGIALPNRTTSIRRPITNEEAALIRLMSQRDQPTRHTATAALLLAGAHTSELGHITADDIKAGTWAIRAHGSAKHDSRDLQLDSWSRQAVAMRAAHLTASLTSPNSKPPVLCTGADGTDAHKQARVCVTVREILTRAGLSDDPSIRPSSLTAYAARRNFDNTGRIEDAARVIGSRSLDSTAALIGYQWVDTDV